MYKHILGFDDTFAICWTVSVSVVTSLVIVVDTSLGGLTKHTHFGSAPREEPSAASGRRRRHFGRGHSGHRGARARAKMAAGQGARPGCGRAPRQPSARAGSAGVGGRPWRRAGSGAGPRDSPPPGAAARAEGSGPPAAALPLPPSPPEEGKELPAPRRTRGGEARLARSASPVGGVRGGRRRRAPVGWRGPRIVAGVPKSCKLELGLKTENNNEKTLLAQPLSI